MGVNTFFAVRSRWSRLAGPALPHSDISIKGIFYKSISPDLFGKESYFEMHDEQTGTTTAWIFRTQWVTILLKTNVPRATAKSYSLLEVDTSNVTHAVSGNANCNKPVVLAKRRKKIF